jgi:hypothetical protein
MPEQQMQRNSSAAFNKPSGSQARLSGAQARLDRSRSQPLNQPLNQENGNDNPHRKGTVHLRRRQLFTICDPYPPPSAVIYIYPAANLANF